MARADLKQRKLDATTERLRDFAMPAGGKWAREAREAALLRLTGMGLPTKRDEYWRWTDPSSLISPDDRRAAVFDAGEPRPFTDIDALKIVFVDGVFDAEASDELAGENLEITRLAEATQADIHWASSVYGVLEERGQTPVERPLGALNTAFASDGICIRVSGVVTRPVNITYLHASETSDAVLHHVVKLEEGAALTLLENGPAAARFNKCIEVEIPDGAKFNHVRTQGRDHERRAVTHLYARLGSNAAFKSFTLTANGVLTRNEVVLELVGNDSMAHVAGAALGDGDFHHDDTVFITHDAERCESRQVFKKVLRNGATGVFQGKILVKKDAQKTDGYQISQSLLLDDDSQFLAKPELEIYADDVVCSHGSTTGAIDEQALYYMRSRGVPKTEAENLLTLSFLAEAIAEIEDEAIAADINDRLVAWLARRGHGKG